MLPLHKLAAKILWQGSLTAILALNSLVSPLWWASLIFALFTFVGAVVLYDSIMMFKFVYENAREPYEPD